MKRQSRMSNNDDAPVASRQSRVRHLSGFLVSGLLALSVDATMLEIGVRLLGMDPLVARLGAISLAMVVGWLAHRTLTFAVESFPTLTEFLRYVAAGWAGAAVNYAVFAGALLIFPGLPRLVALVMASSVAMIFSYIAMRYGVFRRAENASG